MKAFPFFRADHPLSNMFWPLWFWKFLERFFILPIFGRPLYVNENNLHQACRYGLYEELIDVLKEQDLDVNWAHPQHFSTTAFSRACAFGHVKVVQRMMQDPRVDINRSNHKWVTPLIFAVTRGQTEVVELLLADQRTYLNCTDDLDRTALDWAVLANKPKIVQLLVSHRTVHINRVSKQGLTALRLAVRYRFTDCARELVASGRLTRAGPPLEIEPHTESDVDLSQLLQNYAKEPDTTVRQLRKELGRDEEEAANLFALIIFHCDGLLTLKQDD